MKAVAGLCGKPHALRPVDRACDAHGRAKRGGEGAELLRLRDAITIGGNPLDALEKLTGRHVAVLVCVEDVALPRKDPSGHLGYDARLVGPVPQRNEGGGSFHEGVGHRFHGWARMMCVIAPDGFPAGPANLSSL